MNTELISRETPSKPFIQPSTTAVIDLERDNVFSQNYF